MKDFCKVACLSLLSLGLLWPGQTAVGQAPQKAETPADNKSASHREIQDIALKQGGVLTGHVLDAQGTTLEGARISLHKLRGKVEVASAISDENGSFRLAGLRGGLFRVTAGQAQTVVRLWAPKTAPPAAREKLRMVSGGRAVRGQNGDGSNILSYLNNPLVVGGIVATSVAVPVALHNADDDDEPASP